MPDRWFARRLNRLEYDHTIQDICGVDLEFSTSLPKDAGGGEGFDNNGESLYLPPMLMERYLESAQMIVDAAIISPKVELKISGDDLIETPNGHAAHISIYVEGRYDVILAVQGSPQEGSSLALVVDGIEAEKYSVPESNNEFRIGTQIQLARGDHIIGTRGAPIAFLEVKQSVDGPRAESLTAHERLLGLKPGAAPTGDARVYAQSLLARFLRQAFRRPVSDDETAKLLALYDRAEKRGDPFEERMKLAFKGALVSPDFLFRIEKNRGIGMHALSGHELAVRLSYFLWARPPDAELTNLADSGKLSDVSVLTDQVDRLLDDPKSLVFSRSFIGQWLGTKDIGGRVAPVHNTKGPRLHQ